MRRMSGIWPPSNPRRVEPPVRALCPFWPRPLVFPIPEPGPRPTRMRARCEPRGGSRVLREMWGGVALAALAFGRRFVVFALVVAIAYFPSFTGVTSTRWRTR